ncbi:MAG: hypothetical protein KF795_01785 [Labilithrix sp.]|nr:hypothetical protein [Labilithrix sp.]
MSNLSTHQDRWPSSALFRFLFRAVTVVVAMIGTAQAAQAKCPEQVPLMADWTLVVLMHPTDPDIRGTMNANLRALFRVGSSERVNVVVQYEGRRYYVPRGSDAVGEMSASPFDALTESARLGSSCGGLPTSDAERNAALHFPSGNAVSSLVSQAIANFPAEKYALILGAHGAGVRAHGEQAESVVGGVRALGGSDPATRLFGVDLEAGLQKALGPDRRLDLLAFDACLMSAIETAYGMRRVAEVMVASESNSTINGWVYNRILSELDLHLATLNKVSSVTLASIIRASYRTQLVEGSLRGDLRDLSIISLDELLPDKPGVVSALSAVGARVVDESLTSETLALRSACQPPADEFFYLTRQKAHGTSVDIECLCRELGKNPTLATEASTLCAALSHAMLDPERSIPWRAGISVFFPRTVAGAAADADLPAYAPSPQERDRAKQPRFAVDKIMGRPNGWTRFIRSAFGPRH